MFTESYLPTRDGVVTSILLTKKMLEEFGHEVIIFAPEPENPSDREEGVYYFRSFGYKKYPGYRIAPFPSNKCEILKRLDVDVIHTHGLFYMALRSMFAGRTLKKPVVISFHTMVTDASKYFMRLPIPEQVINKLSWFYIKKLLERADAVIAPSHAISEELRRQAPKIRMIKVIPTGIDCARFNPSIDGSAVRKKYGLENNKVILHLGRISWEKNIDLVLKGFALLAQRVDDVRLMIVGDGPARLHYLNMVSQMGISDKVVFTGFVSDEELPFYYAACDAFATASKFETQGLVILEAMACGKPVAGINYRAVAEVVGQGQFHFLFEDDPVSCANALEKAINCPKENGKAIRKRAEQFSAIESVKKLCELYEYVIKEKKRRLAER
ncbi:MAG: glycosyltransferase [Methanomassiliicoccales archaeon]